MVTKKTSLAGIRCLQNVWCELEAEEWRELLRDKAMRIVHLKQVARSV